MALVERIETLLVGNATGLVNTFKQGGTAADAFSAKTTTTGRAMEKLGIQGLSAGDAIAKGLKVGAATGVVAIGALALKGVKDFSDATAAVRGFQRVIGGTAEDSSRLAAATQRMGIDAGTAQSAFGMLAKKIGEGKDTLEQWGVQIVRTKDGSVDFSKTLENISEKYVSIKDPAQRAAFASENFGKGFQSINALLGQGKDNLQQFYDIAAKHHQIFSQDDLQKGLDFTRAMKDLQTAVQGIELELGRALIPALTGTAQILTAVVEALDSFSQSGEGASLVLTGLGTAVAAALGGPVWALAAATIIGVTTALGDNAAAAKVTADAQKRLADQIDAVNTAQAVAAFDKYIRKAAEFVPQVDSMKGRLQAFNAVAEASPAAAQKLIDGWKANGAATGAYEQALAKVVGKLQEHKKNADAAKTANDELANSQDHSTGTTKEQWKAVGDLVKALDDQKKAIQGVHDALIAEQGGEIARQQAVINAAKAQDDYNAAVFAYGTDSKEARDASLNLQQARLDEASATANAQKTTEDFNAFLKDPSAIQANIDKIQEQINKYGDADGALQSQIDKLHGYQDVLAYLATLAPVAVPVTAPGIDEVNRQIYGTLQMLVALQNIGDVNVRVKVAQDEIVGGIVSDRDRKRDFAEIDPAEILELVSALAVSSWEYDFEPEGVRHIGPMAQDFTAVFGLGDDRAIPIVDYLGVLLAGVQALAERVRVLEAA